MQLKIPCHIGLLVEYLQCSASPYCKFLNLQVLRQVFLQQVGFGDQQYFFEIVFHVWFILFLSNQLILACYWGTFCGSIKRLGREIQVGTLKSSHWSHEVVFKANVLFTNYFYGNGWRGNWQYKASSPARVCRLDRKSRSIWWNCGGLCWDDESQWAWEIMDIRIRSNQLALITLIPWWKAKRTTRIVYKILCILLKWSALHPKLFIAETIKSVILNILIE